MPKQKILFGFTNIASSLDITMCMLEKSKQYSIRGLAFNPSVYQRFEHPNWKKLYFKPTNSIFIKLFHFVKAEFHLISAILWADKIFMVYGVGSYTKLNLFIRVLRLFKNKKQYFVEWVGSDIRFPARAMSLNPYFFNIVENSTACISKQQSFLNQKIAFELNAKIVTSPEVSLYLHRSYAPQYYHLMQRVDIINEAPKYPALNAVRPLLVHAPSNPLVKGSVHIRAAIDVVKAQGLDFEYEEITNRSRAEALELIKRCDIFIDQLYGGGYGLACCEAMALGKPALVYLMPAVVPLFPSSLPLINCTVENLADKLKELILSAELRHTIGQQSRKYMEIHYNEVQMQKNFMEIISGAAQPVINANKQTDFA